MSTASSPAAAPASKSKGKGKKKWLYYMSLWTVSFCPWYLSKSVGNRRREEPGAHHCMAY
jgi:hypothetical protein